jgi:hypothetical protein
VTLENFEIRYLAAGERGSLAVVRFQVERKGTVGAMDFGGERAIVDVWVKQKNAWTLAYRVVSRPGPLPRP